MIYLIFCYLSSRIFHWGSRLSKDMEILVQLMLILLLPCGTLSADLKYALSFLPLKHNFGTLRFYFIGAFALSYYKKQSTNQMEPIFLLDSTVLVSLVNLGIKLKKRNWKSRNNFFIMLVGLWYLYNPFVSNLLPHSIKSMELLIILKYARVIYIPFYAFSSNYLH